MKTLKLEFNLCKCMLGGGGEYVCVWALNNDS